MKRCLVVLALLGLASAQEGPTARVAQGLLRGSWQRSTNNRSYASFRGVPYAKPPLGKYRFREPQPLDAWRGEWDASSYLQPCLQYESVEGHIVGSEDCLFLNVHTPRLQEGAALPVLVFIHGGAFLFGTGAVYDPRHLMDRDLVVVTLNYRLGPLGFLSTGDAAVPGNAGLKDQALALRWVRENAAAFGGDPRRVTLSGLSAGGSSVHYHYLSPLSEGSFDRGIAFSGSAFNPWALARRPAQKARALAVLVGCPPEPSGVLADCLRHRPAHQLVQAQLRMFEWKAHLFGPFVPSVEAAGVRGAFLSQLPWHAPAQPLPMLTSVTSEEGLYPAAAYLADPQMLPELDRRWAQLASDVFSYNDSLPRREHARVAELIRKQYLADMPVNDDSFPLLVEALSDRLFKADLGRMAQLHAAHSGQPVHVYRYSFRGEKSLSKLLCHCDRDVGVSHGDDLFHVFHFDDLTMTAPRDMEMTWLLVDLVYSYASTGVPRVPGAEWAPLRPGAPEVDFLEISSPSAAAMASSGDFGNRVFWDSLGFDENENYSGIAARDEL